MTTISRASLIRNDNLSAPADTRSARAAVFAETDGLIEFARSRGRAETTYEEFERELVDRVAGLGRAVVSLFLAVSEERVCRELGVREVRGGREFRRAPAQGRNLLTWFGVVRYRRTYLREVVAAGTAARGFHPLDASLGLFADRVSPNVLSTAVRLATRMSFSEAHEMLQWFLPAAPSTEVIEGALLGYGHHSEAFFKDQPAPEGDGEVLVIHIDSKGVPMAKAEELERRRGKRSPARRAPSPRHRGRVMRKRLIKAPRRKKGDKSKNAKLGTMVVMYTLRGRRGKLLGPINKRVYASFACKKHAVQVARREANKRGFSPHGRHTTQILTDGDLDLASYIRELFPEAIHTVDVMHVIEKLWDAGTAVHKEGSPEHRAWADEQRAALYDGRVADVLAELDDRLQRLPKTGPGNKFRRTKLFKTRRYIAKRTANMNYADLFARDLEISTGPIEGAIKYIMHRRMDHGGMRWIKERAEAVLQLRCIDYNGDWASFSSGVHQNARLRTLKSGIPVRLQQRQPAALPDAVEDAA